MKLGNGPFAPSLVLFERLVFVGAVALVAAVALPSVQNARESARQTQCADNLRRLALACHNYLDAHRVFPPGAVDLSFNPSTVPVTAWGEVYSAASVVPFDPLSIAVPNRFDAGRHVVVHSRHDPLRLDTWFVSRAKSWHFFVLPYLGEVDLAGHSARDDWNSGSRDGSGLLNDISVLVCPSTLLPRQPSGGLGYSSYRGTMGAQPADDPPANAGDPRWMTNGILFPNSAVSPRDLADGYSSTLLIGESTFGFWEDGASCCARFRNDLQSDSSRPPQTPLDFDCTWAQSDRDGVAPGQPSAGRLRFFGFGSSHEKVVHFAAADGSLLVIDKDVDPNLMRLVGTRIKNAPNLDRP